MSTAAVTSLSPLLAAAAEPERKALVVSLHDVAPVTQPACERILAELAQLGVVRCSLLVVPNYHHRGSSFAEGDFVTWLRRLEAAGHEVVIHGYYHDRPPARRETLRDRIITRIYTNSEGEFYDLPYDEAFRRITAAREEFGKAGLKPRGFIAPAWLLSKEGERAAADCELEYTVGLASVRDLRSRRTERARSVVYSVRTPWRRSVSRLWNAALFKRCAYSPLLRISIHPPDLEYPEIWNQIADFVRDSAGGRSPMTYADWVAEMRLRSSN